MILGQLRAREVVHVIRTYNGLSQVLSQLESGLHKALRLKGFCELVGW